MLRGSYPEDVLEHYARRVGPIDAIRDGDLEVIARPIDFLGVNYYFPSRARANGDDQPLGVAFVPGPATADTRWAGRSSPEGLYELLVRLERDYGVPIAITENGAAFEDPPPVDGVVEIPQRIAYFEGHLDAVARAIGDGVDVRRYFAWSLMDNFEWSRGYAKRFGIVHVDYETQRRTVKRSGEWYRDLIARTRDARHAA